MRPGKDIANEFVIMAAMNHLMVLLNRRWGSSDEAKRVLLYLAERYPNSFETAYKHLATKGYGWAK